MRKWILQLAASAMLVAVCATVVVGDDKDKGAAEGTAKEEAIPEGRLGLAPGPVTETRSPDPVVPESSDPGEKKAPPRWNLVSPPMIPHGVGDFLPITREANACVDCHFIEEQGEGDPTPLPASHLTAEGEQKVVDGTRWVCVSCHVPLTDARPLPAATRRAKVSKEE